MLTCRCGSTRLTLTIVRVETAQFLNDAPTGAAPQFMPLGEPEVKLLGLPICLECGAVGPETGYRAAPSSLFPFFSLEEVLVCTPTMLNQPA